MKPTVSVSKTSNYKSLQDRLKGLTRKAVYVGIPATTALDRQTQLLKMAGEITSKSPTSQKKKAKLLVASLENINNAELLFLFSKGSPARGQPARGVIEPAIVAPGNKEAIAFELSESAKASLKGDSAEAIKRLKRAGIAGQNASRKWFTDSRNGWAPNSQFTIDHKESDQPGIATGAMRAAITSVVKEDDNE